jgi:predicted nucleotidyltransferase
MNSILEDQVKPIIINWASQLPFEVRIYLFGSWAKGTARSDSDVDIAIEFIEPMSKSERDEIWYEFHERWQNDLVRKVGLPVVLQLYEGDMSPHIKQYLKDASIVLYSSEEH